MAYFGNNTEETDPWYYRGAATGAIDPVLRGGLIQMDDCILDALEWRYYMISTLEGTVSLRVKTKTIDHYHTVKELISAYNRNATVTSRETTKAYFTELFDRHAPWIKYKWITSSSRG